MKTRRNAKCAPKTIYCVLFLRCFPLPFVPIGNGVRALVPMREMPISNCAWAVLA